HIPYIHTLTHTQILYLPMHLHISLLTQTCGYTMKSLYSHTLLLTHTHTHTHAPHHSLCCPRCSSQPMLLTNQSYETDMCPLRGEDRTSEAQLKEKKEFEVALRSGEPAEEYWLSELVSST